MIEEKDLVPLLEALLLACERPLSINDMITMMETKCKSEDGSAVFTQPSKQAIKIALGEIQLFYQDRGFELLEVASGYQFFIKPQWGPWVQQLWEEKPARYSKALLETLALIAYRQPVTRGEIEAIRGVSTSSSIFKTLHEEREWIRVVGHRDVPGRPGLYATTKTFLDYFGLKSLDELPSLPELMALAQEKEIEIDRQVHAEETEKMLEESLEENHYSHEDVG